MAIRKILENILKTTTLVGTISAGLITINNPKSKYIIPTGIATLSSLGILVAYKTYTTNKYLDEKN